MLCEFHLNLIGVCFIRVSIFHTGLRVRLNAKFDDVPLRYVAPSRLGNPCHRTGNMSLVASCKSSNLPL